VKGQKCAAATVTEKKRTGQSSVLPHPQDVELTPGLATLVSGIVTDLIWCTGESAPTFAESYHELLSLPPQLEPWLMTLDADTAGKQKDTLYKGLYKCVSVLVANPAHYGDHLLREFSMLTLKYCAASSSWKQYFKVKKRLLHVHIHVMIIHTFFFSRRLMLTRKVAFSMTVRSSNNEDNVRVEIVHSASSISISFYSQLLCLY